jgi:quinol-cytochrome oxidoreductase complex cytochrome b subunit
MDRERSWMTGTRVALWVVGALFVILLATGIALTFRYRPDVSFGTESAPSPLFTARRVHRLASFLFVPAVGALAISSIGLFLVRRRRAYMAYPLLAGVAALAASFTGFLLPWDQLSLWAVTVGTNMQGYAPILRGHDVKFVLIGSHEITDAAFSRWFWLHAVAIPLFLVAIAVVLAIKARRIPRSTP